MGKNVYYRNIVFFVQHLQSLVTFKEVALVKASIVTSLQSSTLEWYTSELSDFDCNALNNDSGVKSWVNTLSYCFNVSTSVALGLLTNETYSLDNAQARRPIVQYVHTIMQHGIGCNIVNIANQLSFANQGFAAKLRVFVSSSNESIKAANFIYNPEEKQEFWHKMLNMTVTPGRHYNNFCRLCPFRSAFSRPALSSRSDAFL